MPIGIWELLLILAIVFVLFGAGKLPQVMKDLGKGVKNLKEGLKEGKSDLSEEKSVEKESKKESDQ